jgi:hypothetical protein
MDWIKKNPEKLFLLLASLAALGVGAKNVLGVSALPDRFVAPKTVAKAELPAPEFDLVRQSGAILQAPFNWSDQSVELASGARKAVPLFRSVVIIEKDGRLYDMGDPTEDPIREPVPNEWLIKHQLDYLYSGVLTADPDDDGYSTEDEWKADTVPVDAASHPPYWLKLMFVERKQMNFMLRFAGDNDPQFQINLNDRGKKSTVFVKVGDTFYNGRFTVLKYEKKEGKNKVGILANQSELTLQDHDMGKEVTLVVGEDLPYPTYFGQFDFTLDPAQKEFFVRVGDTFNLLKEPGAAYRLVDIDPTGSFATVKVPDGTEVKFDKGVLPPMPERKP